MGDEVRRTQNGNNNAYWQDNETSWFDWDLTGKHDDVFRFVKLLTDRRLMRDLEHERRRISLSQFVREAKHCWHGVKQNQPDWMADSHSIAISAELKSEGLLLYVILNAYWETLEFELPMLGEGQHWRQWVNTALEPPLDICAKQRLLPTERYALLPGPSWC